MVLVLYCAWNNRPRGHNSESFTDYKRAKAEFRNAHVAMDVTHFIDEQEHVLNNNDYIQNITSFGYTRLTETFC